MRSARHARQMVLGLRRGGRVSVKIRCRKVGPFLFWSSCGEERRLRDHTGTCLSSIRHPPANKTILPLLSCSIIRSTGSSYGLAHGYVPTNARFPPLLPLCGRAARPFAYFPGDSGCKTEESLSQASLTWSILRCLSHQGIYCQMRPCCYGERRKRPALS